MNKFLAAALATSLSVALPGFVPAASAGMCGGSAPVARVAQSAPSVRVIKPAPAARVTKPSAVARVESSQIPTSDRLQKPVVSTAPVAAAEASPAQTASASCKKYFPSVGQLISVPCAQ
jgi:hypothetical protein